MASTTTTTAEATSQQEQNKKKNEEEEEQRLRPPTKPIDYSVWDRIELSDDEDMEGHPNVDRDSLRRWRQQAIRREREERRVAIERYTNQLEWLDAYTHLMRAAGYPDAPPRLVPKPIRAHLDRFEGVPEPLLLTAVPEVMAAEESAVSLETKITREDLVRACGALFERLDAHRAVTSAELDRIVKEDNRKLAPDRICRPGFDSKTQITRPTSSSTSTSNLKKPDEASEKKGSPDSAKKVSDKIKHIDLVVKAETDKKKEDDLEKRLFDARCEEDMVISSQRVYEFAKMGFAKNYTEMRAYLAKNTDIVSRDNADEILAAAFQNELGGRSKAAMAYAHQALVLQFCSDLGLPNAPVFFENIENKAHKATQMFEAELVRNIEHIQGRCKVIKAKESGQLQSIIDLTPTPEKSDVFRNIPRNVMNALLVEDHDMVFRELEQLSPEDKAHWLAKLRNTRILNDNTSEKEVEEKEAESFFKNLLEGKSPAEREVLQSAIAELPERFASALDSGDLDEIDKQLQNMSREEAARVVEICSAHGFVELVDEDNDEEIIDSKPANENKD